MLDLQLEAVADAVGAILAQQRREWSLEHAAFVAEQRAMIADLRRENAELRASLKAAADEHVARVDAVIASIKNGEPGLPGPPGPMGESIVGPQGERGVGVAAITRDGSRLSFETEDGRVFDVGDMPRGERGERGPEGLPGRDGRDGLTIPGANGERGLSGKDGRDGIDGKDGLGFDDLDIAHDGEREFTFRLARGDVDKEWRHSVPAQIYRGVHVDGAQHERGDTVTWGGSLYHCNEATAEKPGAGSTAWTLAVKRGQDGKPGGKGDPGAPGTPGRPGKDLTQMDETGRKW